MTDPLPDVAATLFLLPPDAKVLPVSDLSARLRAKIGPVENGQSVITRPGFRVTTRLIPQALADLLAEFREPSLLTDAVLRFARAYDQDPSDILDLSFDALATLIEARILVPEDSAEAAETAPSLAAGQEFAGYEIEALVRSLGDSEVYRARSPSGLSAALKISRDDRPAVVALLANEALMLDRLEGAVSPKLLGHGTERGRSYVAMEWCDGVSIAVAAQQARAARDRRRLHRLVSRMLDAYGRLHSQGVLHGDIHPGNCLVRDDGRIVILDFGNARLIGDAGAGVDAARAGIPQFYDPLMAAAMLAGRLPPAASPASEQYAIAVLAYLLLTGLHPIEMPAVQDEMLTFVLERPPLPFSARGVAAWPDLEAVLQRGLAKQAEQRFPDVGAFARAFASADARTTAAPSLPEAAERPFDAAVEAARTLAPSPEPPLDRAWFALSAALATEDAELLAAADILAGRAGRSWAAQSVIAQVARARSDLQTESQAITKFLAAAGRLNDGPAACAAILAAVGIFDGATFRTSETAALGGWAAQRLDRLRKAASTDRPNLEEPLLAYVELALVKAGVVPLSPELAPRLETLMETKVSDVWLWSLAHDVYADDRFKALALESRLPTRPLRRALTLLRLYSLTGDPRWVAEANGVLAEAPNARLPNLDAALLVAELKAPETVTLPPFLLLLSPHRTGRRTGAPRRITT